jgi:hypothetical protein
MGILATIPAEVEVEVAGRIMVCRAAMADSWLGLLAGDETRWSHILAGSLSWRDVGVLADLSCSGDISPQDIVRAAKDLVSEVAGRPWWEVVNIVAVAEASWDVAGGEMALAGIAPTNVTLGTWLDAAWLLLRKAARSSSEAGYTQLVSQVTSMPVEEVGDGSMDEADFLAASSESLGR